MSAEAELARRRAKDAERQRRWRIAHGKARYEAFGMVRDAHLDEWRALCAAQREADPDLSHNAVYRAARSVLLATYPDEYVDALWEVGEA